MKKFLILLVLTPLLAVVVWWLCAAYLHELIAISGLVSSHEDIDEYWFIFFLLSELLSLLVLFLAIFKLPVFNRRNN